MRSRTLILLGLLLSGALAAVAEDKKPAAPWKMTADLEEACSCDSACPCWFDSNPTKMNCSGGQVVFIEKGSYGKVPLDGLAIGMMGQSPDGAKMDESIGRWNFVTIYIDEKANPEQRKALEEIARQTVPPAAPPDKTTIRYVSITRKTAGKEHVISLGNYGSFSGHLVDGGLGGAPRIMNPPGADPMHREYQQGRTTQQTYTDAGQNWNWSNSNYMFARFTVDGDEYAKFNQAMMQKMRQEKKN